MVDETAAGGGLGALTEAEQQVVALAREGRTAELTAAGAPRPEVRADLVRCLLAGIPLPGQSEPERVPAGVRIDGAVITGRLDLRGLHGGGGAGCPPLMLRRCDIRVEPMPGDEGRSAVDARHAVIASLALIDCTARGVDLAGARVAGDVDLSSLGPSEEGGDCWVRAIGARIGGSLLADGAELRARIRPGYVSDSPDPWFALSLNNARIEGDVSLREEFGRPPGDVSTGARGRYRPFRADGGVDLHSVTVGANVLATGAWVSAPHVTGMAHREGDLVDFTAFRASYATVRGQFRLNRSEDRPFETEGNVSLHHINIGGNLDLSGACLGRRGVRPIGEAAHDHAEPVDGSARSLFGPVTVGGDLHWRPVDGYSTEAACGIALGNSNIAGDLVLESVVGRTGELADVADEPLWHVELSDAAVSGSLRLIGGEAPLRDIRARGIAVGGSLEISGAVRGVVECARCRVALNVRVVEIHSAEAYARISLQQVECSGVLALHDIERGAESPRITLDLRGMSVDALDDLKAVWRDDPAADRVAALMLDGFEYRQILGSPPVPAARSVAFTDRNVVFPALWAVATVLWVIWPTALPVEVAWFAIPVGWLVGGLCRLIWTTSERDWIAARIAWLDLDRGAQAQPFEHLAGLLRREGDTDGADRVLAHRLERSRAGAALAIQRLLFKWTFNYGLSGTRALATLGVLLFVGWLAVDRANLGHVRLVPLGSSDAGHHLPFLQGEAVLVADTAKVPVQPRAAGGSSGFEIVSVLSSAPDAAVVREVPCGNLIEPALYAMDLFFPLVEVHQEDRCTVSPEDPATWWRMAAALYITAGWLVSSGVVITFSGVVRRYLER